MGFAWLLEASTAPFDHRRPSGQRVMELVLSSAVARKVGLVSVCSCQARTLPPDNLL
jgi:hypothetical protein